LWEEHLLEGIDDEVWDEAEVLRMRRFSGWLR
jgi:hypothetical protein